MTHFSVHMFNVGVYSFQKNPMESRDGPLRPVCNWGVIKLGIDDPATAFALHGGCGMWGLLPGSILSQEGTVRLVRNSNLSWNSGHVCVLILCVRLILGLECRRVHTQRGIVGCRLLLRLLFVLVKLCGRRPGPSWGTINTLYCVF